jgi:hypothetical protein
MVVWWFTLFFPLPQCSFFAVQNQISMQTSSANVFIVLKRDTEVKELHVVQNRHKHLATKRNLLIFAVAYGILLAIVLKLIF